MTGDFLVNTFSYRTPPAWLSYLIFLLIYFIICTIISLFTALTHAIDIVKAELEISCATPWLNWILLKQNIVKSCGYYGNMVRAFLLHRFIVATFLADTEANKKNNFIFLSFNTSEKVRL